MATRRLLRYIDDEEREERRTRLRVQRKRLRDTFDPFDIDETEFIGLYRLPQRLALILRDQIESLMITTTIPKAVRMLIALRFLATGTFQKDLGLNYLTCVSQSVVSRAIEEFCQIMDGKLMSIYIKFPQSPVEMDNIQSQFYEKFNFPGIIGCVDCTHVSMYKPPSKTEHIYLNRYNYYSKNVQFICDYNLRILNVNAKYGGSQGNATIWEKSNVNEYLRSKYDEGELQNMYLIGDNVYPLQPWLMTPIKSATTASEKIYNAKHRQSLNCIKRLKAVLKSRFKCLAKDKCIKYSPFMIGLIINTCATIHNFLKVHNFQDDHDQAHGCEDDEIVNAAKDENENNDEMETIVRKIRASIIENNFSM